MGKEGTTGGDGTNASARTLTALDIQQKEFRVSRFGGYKMRDVDEFLDQLTDAFSALTAENERLRGGGSPVVGSPDLDDVSRQADEIIARARAEAARITAESRASAAAADAPAGSTGRAAVNAYLTREREFLQSLAGLVQQHAEAVKGMAKSPRPAPRAAAPVAGEAGGASAVAGSPVEETGGKPAAAASESATEPAPEPQQRAQEASEAQEEPVAQEEEPPEAQEEEAPTRLPESEETVRIEEPAAARTARGDAEPEGDRSLRELFWGED